MKSLEFLDLDVSLLNLFAGLKSLNKLSIIENLGKIDNIEDIFDPSNIIELTI